MAPYDDAAVVPAGDADLARFGTDPADGPALAVAAVARRLGVAPATLRTWDRRYGLGPSEHSAGEHRRYSPADVDRLLIMRRLTLDGVAPGDAARFAQAPDVGGIANVAGGPRVATPTMVVDAALVDDRNAAARLLAMESSDDVAQWWTTLVEPAVQDLTRRTVVDRPGVDAMRTIESAALGALRARAAMPAPQGAPVVLLLVPAGHSRPLLVHALAAALVAGQVDARIVGGPTGPRQAAELVVMTRPRAVVTVARREDADLSVVGRLVDEHPDLSQFVMVPESLQSQVPLGRSVHRARSFHGLLHEVLAVAAP